jgi:CRISPR-associated endonuclease Csn1
MKKILGLDLGTNSIGWAMIKQDFENKEGEILGLGSRIIPMSQDVLDNFGKGQSHSQTADRTHYRGVRRLYQRDNLRRERLHRVLNVLDYLPEHYAKAIDFENSKGQFKEAKNGEKEVKLNYLPVWNEEKGKTDFKFIFKESFNEMVKEFKEAGQDIKIPYDWTLYYLRKKALTKKIKKEELAWILLNFNQKRGYYQLRGEDEDNDETKKEEFFALIVDRVEATDDKNAKGIWYNVVLENGWVYRRQSIDPIDSWEGKTKEFIVTTQLNNDGSPKRDKDGEVKRSFRAVDSEKDWIAIKQKTEKDIDNSKKTVGQYIYETLLSEPTQKIRGKLVRTIERKFYKKELKAILAKQCNLHEELKDRELYQSCIKELYPNNEAHRIIISDKNFIYLFLDDIIFYQRPLKSKKSTIAVCSYESRTFKKVIKEKIYGGEEIEKEVLIKEGIRAIPKSHPLFQEFRLWQFLSNLKIYRKEAKRDVDVTNKFIIGEEDWVELFDFFNTKKEIEQKNLIDHFVKKKLIPKTEKGLYRWNYVEDKRYPGNETRSQFASRLAKVNDVVKDFYFDNKIEQHLWHIVYSVKDKAEFETALGTFAEEYGFDIESFVKSFVKFPPFSNDYGSYSQKALSKLLPLMRLGKYWDEQQIQKTTLERINKIIDGEFDEGIKDRVREKAKYLNNVGDFKGMPLWLACYVVYNRHSESSDGAKWNTPNDIDKYLNEFKQHSLRNPIVEQVVTETLRVVRDIWTEYGKSENKFFDEIHVELGRDMKNPADRRKSISARNIENENTNIRIREVLKELMNEGDVEGDVKPYSPSQQEILKIYEEGIVSNPDADYSQMSEDDIAKIRNNNSPSNSDIKRYKLWLEQGYVSPYTGQMIPLSKLFTTDYQIEHIIPQARYFDDSLSNKVICESEVNHLKSNKTAYEFLKTKGGEIVELSAGRSVRLFSIGEYEAHCSRYFKNNRTKLQKLMSEDIPEGFIQRQMNDSRYISKLVKSLLNNIVKDGDENDTISPNVVPVTGAITNKLKQDWGLHDKWNELVVPRFKRLNELTGTNNFGNFDSSINAFRCDVPDELKKGFSKKRIDHRHHAMDALVIACTTRKHIHYLNALNAENENYALRDSLLVRNDKGDYKKTMLKPWNRFPVDALNALESTVVSFKQNTRVINKTNNKTLQWVKQSDGKLKKQFVLQTKGDNWAIRKPLHKETVSGAVSVRNSKEVSFVNGLKDWKNLVDKKLKKLVQGLFAAGMNEKEVAKHFKKHPYQIEGENVSKLMVYSYTQSATATRTLLTDKFTRKQLESVTDSGIRKILVQHLLNYKDEKGKEDFTKAFNQDGLEELNKNIVALNNGVPHQPIYKVRVYEEGSKFEVGYTGAKPSKYVEAAKGTNLFFAIYLNEQKQKREYETVPLNIVIEHQKQVALLPKIERTPVPLNKEKGMFLFSLSPNDLVYIPSDEEMENLQNVNFESLNKDQVRRIYKMISSSGNQCFFVKSEVSSSIWNKNEFSALNKMEKNIEGVMVKEKCWKLQVNRLGQIISVTNHLGKIVQVGE